MNFEKAFENYKNGTATEEERAYVENEIAKARKINEAIEAMDSKRVVEKAESDDVKKAIKKMKVKTAVRIAIISAIVVVALALIASISAVIYVNSTASGKAEFTKSECIEAAKQVVSETAGASAELRVRDVERDIRFEYGKPSSAKYYYEIEIAVGYMEYEVLVDSITGKAVIVDIGD